MKVYIYFVALLSMCTLFSQDLSQGYNANDLAQYPMQPLAKPDYLTAVSDPSFPRTSIRRISEASPGDFIVPMYNTIQSWNADESLLLLYDGAGTHKLLNGSDYTFIRDLIDIRPDDIEAVFWHFTDPDILFYMDRSTADLIRYNVRMQSKTIIANMRALSGCSSSSSLSTGNDVQMMSWDSDVFAFRCGNTNAYYYRISTGTLTEFNIADLNYTAPMPFPSGNLFYHNKAVYDANGNFLRELNISSVEHSCLGKLSNGDDAYFAIAFAEGPNGGCLGTLVAHNATTANCFVVTPVENYGYSKSGTHISSLAHKNSQGGWVAVSSMGYQKDGVQILDQELFIAKVNEFDSSVYRVAHHRSDEDDIDYWGEPHVTISPSGTRLLFGSDWSGSEDGTSVDAYVAELSSYTSNEVEEEEPTEEVEEEEPVEEEEEPTEEVEEEEEEPVEEVEEEEPTTEEVEEEGPIEDVEQEEEPIEEVEEEEPTEDVEEEEPTEDVEEEEEPVEEVEEEEEPTEEVEEGSTENVEEEENEPIEEVEEEEFTEEVVEEEEPTDDIVEEEPVEEVEEEEEPAEEVEGENEPTEDVEEEEPIGIVDEEANEPTEEVVDEEEPIEDVLEEEPVEEVEEEEAPTEAIEDEAATDGGENEVKDEEETEALNRETILYPNPATEVLHIASDFEPKRIMIHDLSGRSLLTPKTADIDISMLAPGFYVVRFLENQKLVKRIFVKQ